jgi:hypothetical protein
LPGAPPAALDPAAKRIRTLGNVCLGLGLLELLYSLQHLVGPLLTKAIFRWEKAFLPKTRGGPPMGKMMDAAARFAERIAVWEVVRAIPFIVATSFLIAIAVRLRRGDRTALGAVRIWTYAALGVVALSLLIQVLVTVPATLAYEKMLVDLMPATGSGAAAPPFDLGAVMGRVTLVTTVLSLLIGTLFLSVWPIALLVWAGRLERAAPEG